MQCLEPGVWSSGFWFGVLVFCLRVLIELSYSRVRFFGVGEASDKHAYRNTPFYEVENLPKLGGC